MKENRSTLKEEEVTIVRKEPQPDLQKLNLRGWTINLPETKKEENPNLVGYLPSFLKTQA